MSRPDIELVIFDCDGVLVDSEPIANRVFAEQLSLAGFPFTTAEAMQYLKGRSLVGCLDWLAGHFGRLPPAEFVDTLQRATFAAYRTGLRTVEGIEEALAAIQQPICVASNSDPVKLQLTLSLGGLLARFQGRMFSASEVPNGKPAPDLFLHAAATLQTPPAACLVVEDSPHGVAAAVAAGMRVLGYAGSDHADPEALAALGALVFRRMADLPGLIACGRD